MFKAIAVAVALAATTTVAGAQATSAYKSTAKPAAQQTATAKRHTRVHKAETQAQLQKEAKISYDITVPGKTGIDEVNVNAVDGTVVAKAHESPKAEKAEAAAEAKKKTTAKK